MNRIKLPTEEELKLIDQDVDNMLEEWDIVNCYLCGKKISILKGKLYTDALGEHWVHKNGADCG